jgi:hypothetical protein
MTKNPGVTISVKIINTSSRLATIAFSLIVSLGGLPQRALAAQDLTLATSAAIACLTLQPGKSDRLEYPPDLYARKDGGEVNVELRFSGPDAEPDVKMSNREAIRGLRDAVTAHVERFRVPCMEPGDPPVVLRQTYVFRPNDGRRVMSSTAVDAADAGRKKLMRCIAHNEPGSRPTYSRSALLDGAQGNYLVSMRFVAPDRPPEIEWVATSKNHSLRGSVEEFVSGYRMPCLQGEAITVKTLFKFQIEGGPRNLIKDLTLAQFLGSAAEGLPKAYFDLDSMSCPFDVRVSYYQPYDANIIGELEKADASRKPLLDWLTKVAMRVDKPTSLAILGQQFTLSIPCGTVEM